MKRRVKGCVCIVFVYIGSAILFLDIGCSFALKFPFCFGSEEPNTLAFPDLRNLSLADRKSLLQGYYFLSSEYRLKMIQYDSLAVDLCVIKRQFSRVSACFTIPNVKTIVICGPDMRPNCLPGSSVDHGVGATIVWPRSTMYTILNLESSMVFKRKLTDVTTLSAVWYDVLGCHVVVKLTIAAIVFGVPLFICCLVACLGCAAVCCFWLQDFCLDSCCKQRG